MFTVATDIDLMNQCSSQCKTLMNCLINQGGYTQLLNQYTKDYRTRILLQCSQANICLFSMKPFYKKISKEKMKISHVFFFNLPSIHAPLL